MGRMLGWFVIASLNEGHRGNHLDLTTLALGLGLHLVSRLSFPATEPPDPGAVF